MSRQPSTRRRASSSGGSGRVSSASRNYPVALGQWIAKISKIPLLTHSQEIELGESAREGDRNAFAELVQSNLRLVVRIASRYVHPNVPLIDLVQEGNIGLLQAADRFDPDKGFRFSTYAVWWIRRAILRALSYDSRPIGLPEHIVAGTTKLERAAIRLRQQLGREPTRVEIAGELDVTPEQVEFLSGVAYDYVSLDIDVSPTGHMQYRDVLEDVRQRPERWLSDLSQQEDVERYLGVLTARERDILRTRFGIGGERHLTLKETGLRFNLTRERIRQIEKQALGQLRESWAGPHEDALSEVARYAS